MNITPHSPINPSHLPPSSINLPALKQDLKTTMKHFNHTVNSLLQSPDTLNATLCQDISSAVLHLHQLAHSITQADPQDSLKEAASIILTILKAPVYV